MRKTLDFLILLLVGLVVTFAVMAGFAGTAHLVSPSSKPTLEGSLWVISGIGGFVLGLMWRFICWDLPAIGVKWFRENRRHMGSLLLIGLFGLVIVFA